MSATTPRNPATMLERALGEWGGRGDLWVFGYASLIWRPDFDFSEQRLAHATGWHRALQMWSRTNRGTPEQPGLVFALLSGGSCKGVAYRVPRACAETTLRKLWPREMPNGVYDPRWLHCATPAGSVTALAFTLSRKSPSYTGELDATQYRRIFANARGRYGSTLDYAQQTYDSLLAHGIRDRALEALLKFAK